jgi:ketosteroid isomerase-like protein
MMRTTFILFSALAVMFIGMTNPVQAGDKEDIEALIKQYTELEDANDMAAQSQLMTADRTWVGFNGRKTDNAAWMDLQQVNRDNFEKKFPGVEFRREVRNLQVRLMGNVAVATFHWYSNRIIPADLSSEKVKMLGLPAVPATWTQVWTKEGNTWKIAHTHSSPLYSRSN